MSIFILRDNVLATAKKVEIKRERDLEDWLENSPMALVENEFILWIDRQPRAQDEEGTIFPDLLGVDSEGNLVIVEFKRGRTPRTVVAQLLEYAAWAGKLPDSEIHQIAETYFDTRDGYQGKTFSDVFMEVFDMPETDELPSFNNVLRLFIVAEDIPSRISQVCRFLRTSYKMDVSCIAVSKFHTESGEEIINMEIGVGDEDVATSKAQQHTSPPSRWTGDKPVKQVVWEAVQEFTDGSVGVEFEIKQILVLIRKDNPDFKRPTMDGVMIADTVNHPSRGYHQATEDRYWRVARGKYRLYDPAKDRVGSDGEAS